MKTCANCGKDLPTSLDEFGPALYPICMDCYFDGKPKEDDRIAEIEEEIEEMEDEISGLESEISDLESRIRAKEKELKEIRSGKKPKKVTVDEKPFGLLKILV